MTVSRRMEGNRVEQSTDEQSWVLKADHLTKRYGPGCAYCSVLVNEQSNRCPVCGTVYACTDVSFALGRGEVLGIVGESGSGKSTLMQIMNLSLPVDEGALLFQERDDQGLAVGAPVDLLTLDKYARRVFRNERLGIVYQRPELGLNMKFTVGGNVAEKLLLANWRNVGRIRERTSGLMRMTELSPERIDDDPKKFSGGMLQRVQIAKALASSPVVLLLDEVTTGLDLSVQARVLDLIKQLRWELHMTMLLVSHDLGVIKQLAERTIVMKSGQVVESGLTDQILEDPQHPYTQLLVSSAL